MIYVFLFLGLIVLCWLVRLLVRHISNKRKERASRRNPDLPVFEPVPLPTFTEIADSVAARMMPPPQRLEPDFPPGAARRGSAASSFGSEGYWEYSPVTGQWRRRSSHLSTHRGVLRAHHDCESDPDLPSYSEYPSQSNPCLVDADFRRASHDPQDFPPPGTPPPERNAGAPGASPGLGVNEDSIATSPQLVSLGELRVPREVHPAEHPLGSIEEGHQGFTVRWADTQIPVNAGAPSPDETPQQASDASNATRVPRPWVLAIFEHPQTAIPDEERAVRGHGDAPATQYPPRPAGETAPPAAPTPQPIVNLAAAIARRNARLKRHTRRESLVMVGRPGGPLLGAEMFV